MAKGIIFRISLAVVASGYAARMLQSDLQGFLVGTSQIPGPNVVQVPVQLQQSVVDVALTTTQSPKPKPIDPFAWNLTTTPEKCFYVEDICRTSHRWFYRPSTEGHQPRLKLLKDHEDVRWMKSAYRREYIFEHPEDGINATSRNRCVESPVTNHLVLFSKFNDMLGEFYDRGLFHLWRLWKENRWLVESQLYIHLQPTTSKKLLDSHHLFTSMFRTMPLLDFNVLLDETPCTCLPRLIFCGYDIEYLNETIHVRGKPSETVVQETVVLEPIAMEPPGYNPQSALGTPAHRELHSHVRATMIESNPHVLADIAEFRKVQLNKAGGRTTRKMSDSELSKWKLVGLAQRSGRRRWRDLDSVMLRAQSILADRRIALVEVNVESSTSTAYHQIVMHGALDGLVGIHGAQLTEAVWMKPGSWVVELLPYVPDGVFMGTWTKTTDAPTPIGWMFDGTELNHAGVPLQRESAPYCWDPKDVEDPDLECWRIGNNPWDNRDFVFDASKLEMVLSKLLVGTSPSTKCSEYQERAGSDMVLYNINCANGNDEAVAAHHFYWTKQ